VLKSILLGGTQKVPDIDVLWDFGNNGSLMPFLLDCFGNYFFHPANSDSGNMHQGRRIIHSKFGAVCPNSGKSLEFVPCVKNPPDAFISTITNRSRQPVAKIESKSSPHYFNFGEDLKGLVM
jgi:hypothetical protein